MISFQRIKSIFAALILITISSCEDPFKITPYDTDVPYEKAGLTETNIAEWRQRSATDTGAISIAFISDPHYHYGDLADLVQRINSDPSIDIVVIPGDLTDQGLVQEFEWFTDIVMQLEVPWIATIGNHDHLSNGRQIYENMFGPRNFSVDLQGFRFIFFDDTVWESDFSVDLGWLADRLATAGNNIPIVIAHIPLETDQLANGEGAHMRQLLLDHDVPLFVHGHLHAFVDQADPSGFRRVGIPWPATRNYVRITLAEQITVEQIAL